MDPMRSVVRKGPENVGRAILAIPSVPCGWTMKKEALDLTLDFISSGTLIRTVNQEVVLDFHPGGKTVTSDTMPGFILDAPSKMLMMVLAKSFGKLLKTLLITMNYG